VVETAALARSARFRYASSTFVTVVCSTRIAGRISLRGFIGHREDTIRTPMRPSGRSRQIGGLDANIVVYLDTYTIVCIRPRVPRVV
jgi:hypothetical protein